MADQDDIPYADQPLSVGKARRLASDARINEGQLLAYLGPNGTPLALTGDEVAPFVRVIYEPPGLTPVSVIPTVATTPLLVAAVINAELHEAWVTDSRDPLTLPAARWIQLFDRVDAPTAGDVPSYAPIGMCTGGTTGLDFIEAPLLFTKGIVIALSSTPNIYTAIADSTDFAITARVLGA